MRKIIGVTVGTPMSVPKIKEKLKMTADEVKFADGETFQQKYENGELTGKDGKSGVYVGSGDMPDNCNVQIDPEGDGETLEAMIDAALRANAGLFKGETPERGVDYWTAADKQEIVTEVLAALPVYDGEVEIV